MLKGVLLHLSRQRSVYDFVVQHDLLRSLAWRYVAGEGLDDALAVGTALNARGLKVSLDHLGENVAGAAEARRAADAYLTLLDAAAARGIDGYVSLKLTQMGLDISENVCRENLTRVLDRAMERGGWFVRVDMEGSAYTARTLDLCEHLWTEGYRNLGVVLQAYLYRASADVERTIRLGMRVRLCKGAYLEPPELAWPDKADVDASYARLAERLLEADAHPAFATHDERLIQHVQDVARKRRTRSDRFELQMLYGVRRDLQLQLAQQGYAVRTYVPYGREWYPYLMRRLAERPANLAFFVRSMAQEASSGRLPRAA